MNYNYNGWTNVDDIQVRNVTTYSRIQRTTYSIGGTPIAQRVIGDPVSGNNGLTYIYTDHLGSPTAIGDDSNNALTRQRYYPFGEQRTNSGPKFDQSWLHRPSREQGYWTDVYECAILRSGN